MKLFQYYSISEINLPSELFKRRDDEVLGRDDVGLSGSSFTIAMISVVLFLTLKSSKTKQCAETLHLKLFVIFILNNNKKEVFKVTYVVLHLVKIFFAFDIPHQFRKVFYQAQYLEI